MVGNPNHDPKTGEFASGHNAGGGNRAVAEHIANQHKPENLWMDRAKQVQAEAGRSHVWGNHIALRVSLQDIAAALAKGDPRKTESIGSSVRYIQEVFGAPSDKKK